MAIVEIKFIAPDYTTARAAKFVGRSSLSILTRQKFNVSYAKSELGAIATSQKRN
jgi:hypothetical protein